MGGSLDRSGIRTLRGSFAAASVSAAAAALDLRNGIADEEDGLQNAEDKGDAKVLQNAGSDLRLRQEIGNGCQGIAERDIVGFP